MPAMTVKSPILDLRECLLIGHSKKFFELMDGFKPYLVLSMREDEVVIQLLGKEIDLIDARDRILKMAHLGYSANVCPILKTHWSGAFSRLELEPMRISWIKDELPLNGIDEKEGK